MTLIQDGARLLVAEPASGEVVAEHLLAAPGEVVLDEAHYEGCYAHRPVTKTVEPFDVAASAIPAITFEHLSSLE
ncbi:hypothetical protein GONAM_03_00370 [Gordonia namibiensis NBRC 108229]|uniref:Uncharacterized protein n=1 Tax=Gordonia namibiensis NBRC 108229 TaxID=1208314 RepID=K6VRN0_9ACTN|nr:hypothetical protein [Gordonia namibiensis]GAB98858.1 hypothetical protein GONAM_03_00370 [Gordonia namibiensis NBRC 108229]